jgi:hypothetical protein
MSRTLCSESEERIHRGLGQLQEQFLLVERRGQAALSDLTNFYNELRRLINQEEDSSRKKLTAAITSD